MLLGRECCSDAFFPGGKAERGKTEGCGQQGRMGLVEGGKSLLTGFTPALPGIAAQHWQESAEGH